MKIERIYRHRSDTNLGLWLGVDDRFDFSLYIDLIFFSLVFNRRAEGTRYWGIR